MTGEMPTLRPSLRRRLLAVGASRKSFLTRLSADAASKTVPPSDRLGASVAAALRARRAGAAILRVHDVRATAQAIDLDRALSGNLDRAFAAGRTNVGRGASKGGP